MTSAGNSGVLSASFKTQKPATSKKAKILAPIIKSRFVFLEVAGAPRRVEVTAPGSWSDLPQLAQSHAAGSTSLPHSVQNTGGGAEG
jgi:hypothetical protein